MPKLDRCGTCGKFISHTDGASCTKCPNKYHSACIKIPYDVTRKQDWICQSCNLKLPYTDVPCTDVQYYSPEKYEFQKPVLSLSSSSANEVIEISGINFDDTAHDITGEFKAQELTLEIRLFRTELESVRSCLSEFKEQISSNLEAVRDEMRVIRQDVQSLSAAFEICNSRMESLESRVQDLESGSQLGSHNEVIAQLENTVTRLVDEIDDRDQRSLQNDVEITGIPEIEGESVHHIVLAVAKKLGSNLDERDIVSARRVGPRRAAADPAPGASSVSGGTAASVRPRPIAISLTRRILRDQLLKNARVRRGATTEDLGLPITSHSRFYMNERLTKKNRVLFGKTRDAARRMNWAAPWTRDGRVLVRRDQSASIMLVKNESDLLRVFGNGFSNTAEQ